MQVQHQLINVLMTILFKLSERANEKCDEIESIICYISCILRCMLVQSLLTDNTVVRVILPWNCVTGNGGVGCMIGKAQSCY